MNRIRYLAAGLLCLTGIIHVAQLAMAQLEASVIIMVIFGVAYLIIGIFFVSEQQDRVSLWGNRASYRSLPWHVEYVEESHHLDGIPHLH